jgi:hypothetical protein
MSEDAVLSEACASLAFLSTESESNPLGRDGEVVAKDLADELAREFVEVEAKHTVQDTVSARAFAALRCVNPLHWAA